MGSNRILYDEDEHPNHVVVIKYVPKVKSRVCLPCISLYLPYISLTTWSSSSTCPRCVVNPNRSPKPKPTPNPKPKPNHNHNLDPNPYPNPSPHSNSNLNPNPDQVGDSKRAMDEYA